MRLLPFILYLATFICLSSCVEPISKDFLQHVNAVLVQERNGVAVAQEELPFDAIKAANAKEQRILDVIQKIQLVQQDANGKIYTEKDKEGLLREADSITVQIGLPSLSLWTKSQVGFYYYRLAQLENALPYFVEASRYLASPNFEPTIDPVDCLLKNAYFFGNIGDHQLAINNLEQALRATTIGDKDTAVVQYALGYQYQIMKEDAKAKEYFLYAKVGAQHRDPIRYAKALGELALLEMNAGNKTNAEQLLREDIELSELHGDERNTMFAKIRLGKLYIDMQRWEEARSELERAESYVANKDYLLGFQQEIIQLQLLIHEHLNDLETQLVLHRNLQNVEEQLKYTDGADAVMNVKLELLREQADWNRHAQESKLQKSNLTGIALLTICTLLIILAVSLRVSKLRSLRLQQSEFEYKITTIELAKFKSDSRYEQAQHTIKSYLTFIDERNVAIDHLKEEVNKLGSETSGTIVEQREKLQDLLSEHLMSEENWYRFKRIFIAEYRPFYNDVIRELVGITESQLRIVLLHKIGVSNHEMANLLGVGQESIRKAKQRLRKKYGEQYEHYFQSSVNRLAYSDTTQ